MRTEEFVLRGKTASDEVETLNFSGFKLGYAYKLIEFQIYPSIDVGNLQFELTAAITAGKTAAVPNMPDFDDEGLIGSTYLIENGSSTAHPASSITEHTVINDTFLITQNLLLSVKDTGSGSPMPVNWQCRFMPVKMSGSEEAVANYKQFTISDG